LGELIDDKVVNYRKACVFAVHVDFTNCITPQDWIEVFLAELTDNPRCSARTVAECYVDQNVRVKVPDNVGPKAGANIAGGVGPFANFLCVGLVAVEFFEVEILCDPLAPDQTQIPSSGGHVISKRLEVLEL